MKNGFLSALVFLSFASFGIAQKTQGHASYSAEISSDNPEMAAAVTMMEGTTMDLYFKNDITRSEVNIGEMFSIQTIVNQSSNEILLLIGSMMGQKAVKTTVEEFQEEYREEQPTQDVQLIEETKEVLGYLCKKAILIDEDGNETVIWYTEEFELSKVGQDFLNAQIPGLPLEFEKIEGEMTMNFKATKIETKVKNASEIFSMDIPSNYDEMTLKEMKGMRM